MKAFVRRISRFLVIALVAVAALSADRATARMSEGCQECSVWGCTVVWDGSFGMTVCEVGFGMNLGNFGFTCTTSGEVCYKDSMAIRVSASDPCDLWSWLMGWC